MNIAKRMKQAAEAYLEAPPGRAGIAAFRSFAWPVSGEISRDVPDWVDHWQAYALQNSRKQLGHVDAFSMVPMVNVVVKKLARDVASVERKVWRGRGDKRVEVERLGKLPDEGGNLADLLAYANPLQTGRQLIERTVASRVLSGNGYWYLRRFVPTRPPAEIYCLPGHRTRVVPGPKRTVYGYEYQAGDANNWGVPANLKAEDVIPFAGLHVEDRPDGLSELEAIVQAYQAEYYALHWVRDFFFKGGQLAGIWTTRKDANVAPPTDAEKKAIKAALRRQSGYQQAWEPVIVAGIDFVANSMKLSEMELQRQIDMIDRKIVQAVLMPPWQVGMEKEGGLGQGSSAKTDQANYWLETVAGFCAELDDVITERLCPLFGKDLSVKSDLGKVLAVQNARLEQAKVHRELAGGRSIETINEAREAMDLPADMDPESDKLWVAPPPAFGAPGDEKPPGPGKGSGGEDARARDGAEGPGHKPEKVRLGEERDTLRDRARVSLERYQARFENLVLERLAEQRATVRERLRHAWEAEHPQLRSPDRTVRLAIDWSNLMPEPDDADLTRVQKLLNDLLKARGAEALRDLEAVAGVVLEVTIDATRSAWADFVRQQVDRAIRVPDRTTAEALRNSLAEGLDLGETLDALLARVEHVFEGRRSNALTIARTETLPAYSWATYQASEQSGIVEGHEWLTSRSGTGGRHAENPDGRYTGLDGQFRALGEAFDVGGVALMYPGDPAGPISELANCVCSLVAKLKPVELRERRWRAFLGGKRPHVNGNGKPKSRIAELFARGRS